MGRKSSLTSDQWIQVERRHVVGGESLRALAEEFGINESSLRRKIKPHNAAAKTSENPLAAIAKKKIAADVECDRIAAQIAALPYAKQQIVSDLARKLSNISDHVAGAAEVSAASAHRLSILANQELQKVDDVDPMKSVVNLQAVALLQKMASTASEIPLNLLKANKDRMPEEESLESLSDDALDERLANLGA